MSKNRILGAIGVLWGGGMLLARLARDAGDAAANEAYAAGQTIGPSSERFSSSSAFTT